MIVHDDWTNATFTEIDSEVLAENSEGISFYIFIH